MSEKRKDSSIKKEVSVKKEPGVNRPKGVAGGKSHGSKGSTKGQTRLIVTHIKSPTASPREEKRTEKTAAQKARRKRQVQQSIKDHFSVRRSSRKCKSLIESEKQEEIAHKLRTKNEDGLKVVEVEGKGRGVVSTRPFKKGELVCEYSGKLITYEEAKKKEEEYSKDSDIGCYMYYFTHKTTKLCVDATEDNGRMGRLLNHSKTLANVVTKLYEVDDHPYLCLVAARDIREGEELEYDYGERSKEVIESHPWLKS